MADENEDMTAPRSDPGDNLSVGEQSIEEY